MPKSFDPTNLRESLTAAGLGEKAISAAIEAAERDFYANADYSAGRKAEYKALVAGHAYRVTACDCKGKAVKQSGKPQVWADGSHKGTVLIVAESNAGGHDGRLHVKGFIYRESLKDSESGRIKGPVLAEVAYSKFFEHHKFEDLGRWNLKSLTK